ncbi:hypothetical protein C8J56DRAFT_933500 [Mycena floridula]|nr:hypothetical protein C8J56DRAFT_933500 [Mycena floridula]
MSVFIGSFLTWISQSALLRRIMILSQLSIMLFSYIQVPPSSRNIALARLYAPQWRFHPDEIYWPSTVDYFLAGVKLYDRSGNVVSEQPDKLTRSNLADVANAGAGLFLSLDIEAEKETFLRGQNLSLSDVNTFIVEKSNGIVDIYYWLFTPFNLGKKTPLAGQIGDHVGDWERMTVRTVDGVATEVDYHAHIDSGSGTIPWDEVLKFDSRPVGYVAHGSHGFWASAGAHTVVDLVVLQAQDLTGDGISWDTQDSLRPFSYPERYTGSENWLNFAGRWGNKGDNNCWWYIIYPGCATVTGPVGPVRPEVLGAADIVLTTGSSKTRMSDTLSHTLGTASTMATSTYTVHLSSSVHAAAAQGSYTELALRQTCTDDTSTAATVSLDATSAMFILSPDACPSDSVLTSYTLGLCGSDSTEDCTFASQSRRLRAYSADRTLKGIQNATAIVVNDLIDWSW